MRQQMMMTLIKMDKTLMQIKLMKIIDTILPFMIIFWFMVVSIGCIIVFVDKIPDAVGDTVFFMPLELVISIILLLFYAVAKFLIVIFIIKYPKTKWKK